MSETSFDVNDPALHELAARCGIEPEYYDVTGRLRTASAETKRILIQAMGIPARTNSDIHASLSQLQREEWRPGLPPVLVAYADRPTPVELIAPASSNKMTWEITLEGGGMRAGNFLFQSLDLIATSPGQPQVLEKRLLRLPNDLPFGYHSLAISPGDHHTTLIFTPGRCWLPPNLDAGHKLWGLSAQLYLLRSVSNWGIGDFSDLRQFLEIAASAGAATLGVNPIHSSFLDHPSHASPYSPSDRALLNVLNIDARAVPNFAGCEEARQQMDSNEFQAALAKCREASHVQYDIVARIKLQILRLLFTEWQARRRNAHSEAFDEFSREKGEHLARASVFEALRRKLSKGDFASADWRNWPPEFRDPESTEVQKFAASHESEIEFYSWLQWIAEEQLARAVSAAGQMSVGLYGDIAVGAHPAGAEAWINQSSMAMDASIGAPPDPFSEQGQVWGLPPYNPRPLRENSYRPFIELMRANMRYRGAIRIDHAMALQHLFWIPNGHSATEGAYVRYPLEDLLGIVALESQRNKCVVIAEDLGTVPPEFRTRIAIAGILSYRVLLFERGDDGSFIPPARYPALSIAVASNHDLPTLRAWWEGADLELKARVGLLHADELQRERQNRARDRTQLLEALRTEGLISADDNLGSEQLLRAVHSYLARAQSVLALAQLDDIAAEKDPVNLPSTVDQYPNWSRRLGVSLEELPKHPGFSAITEALASGRNDLRAGSRV